jgi:hypothetical protein
MAQETLESLISTSQSIENSITTGVQSVAGAQAYSNTDSVIDGTMEGYIEQQTVDAYNQELMNVTLQDYSNQIDVNLLLDQQYDLTKEEISSAIDIFSQAVVEMSTVFMVNDLATEAEMSGTDAERANVQSYISQNQDSLVISSQTVEVYNQSLDDIGAKSAEASAFIAAANNQSFMDRVSQDLSQADADFASISLEYDVRNDQLNAMFTNSAGEGLSLAYNSFYQLEMQREFLTSTDVLMNGSTEDYYTSFLPFRDSGGRLGSPINGDGPPPNVLLYESAETMTPMGYTDADGNIFYYSAGDTVIDPATSIEVGYFDSENNFVCTDTTSNYCAA